MMLLLMLMVELLHMMVSLMPILVAKQITYLYLK